MHTTRLTRFIIVQPFQLHPEFAQSQFSVLCRSVSILVSSLPGGFPDASSEPPGTSPTPPSGAGSWPSSSGSSRWTGASGPRKTSLSSPVQPPLAEIINPINSIFFLKNLQQPTYTSWCQGSGHEDCFLRWTGLSPCPHQLCTCSREYNSIS